MPTLPCIFPSLPPPHFPHIRFFYRTPRLPMRERKPAAPLFPGGSLERRVVSVAHKLFEEILWALFMLFFTLPLVLSDTRPQWPLCPHPLRASNSGDHTSIIRSLSPIQCFFLSFFFKQRLPRICPLTRFIRWRQEADLCCNLFP